MNDDLIIGVCQKCGKPMCECSLSFEDKHNIKTPVWPEKGSLPPVGVECEAICNSDDEPRWFKVQYLGERENRPMLFHLEFNEISWADFMLTSFEFRPIKTERERFVERLENVTHLKTLELAALPQCNGEIIIGLVLGHLYDLGVRIPEDE